MTIPSNPQANESEAGEITEAERDLLRFIGNTPVLLSCLYDTNLLPEQLKRRSREWGRMLIIAAHFRASLIPSAPPAAQGPSAGAKPEDPSASPTKQQAELQEIARKTTNKIIASVGSTQAPICVIDEIILSALSAVSSKEEEKGKVGETGTLGQRPEEI